MLSSLQEVWETKHAELQKRKWEAERLVGDEAACQNTIDEIKKKRALFDEARLLLSNASRKAREQSRQAAEQIITDALQTVYGDHMECRIHFKERASGKPEAELLIYTNHPEGALEVDPTNGHGGGVVDVVSLAARLAQIELNHDPKLVGTIFLDEPTKNIMSAEYRQAVALFLKKYCETFQRQVVIITQHEETVFAAEKAFTVLQTDGISHLQELNTEGTDVN